VAGRWSWRLCRLTLVFSDRFWSMSEANMPAEFRRLGELGGLFPEEPVALAVESMFLTSRSLTWDALALRWR